MSSTFRPALAGAAVVVALAVGAIYLTGQPTGTVGGPAAPTPSPSASAPASAAAPPSPIALTDTSNWVSFASARYGYEIGHPPAWTATNATRAWTLKTDRVDWSTSAADHFVDRGEANSVLVTAFADDVPSGTSDDEWMTAYNKDAVEEAGPEMCIDSVPKKEPIIVDGHPGTIFISDLPWNAFAAPGTPCADTQAFVFFGGRVHVFAIWKEGQLDLFRAFLSTVHFQQ